MNADSYGFIFVFQILPTIVFFASLTSLLFYLGVIQVVVKFLALVLTKILKISGAESLSVIGNIFLGQTEAPLMIKAYLERMNKSEILLVMIGKIEYAHKKFTQGLKNPLNPSDTQDTYGEYYLNKQTYSNGFPSDIFAVCTTGKCDCQ